LRRALFALLLAGCNPTFPDRPSVVDSPRVLAVKGEPAEARPGNSVSYSLLVGGGDDSGAAWAYCGAPKPLDENNIVAAGCLVAKNEMAFGSGASASAALPQKACQLFGPDPPPQMPGQPPLRPRDPDVSGGYYQPVQILVDGQQAFALERITCNLAAAGSEVSIQFGQEYTPNNNPTLIDLQASAPLDGIAAGSKVTFTAGWTDDSPESYPVYDLTQLVLVQHRESMRVSWFATAGSFDHDSTGRGEDEMETTTEDVWTAPKDAGPVTLWTVLRDSRGGVDWRSYALTVVSQ
jgi:hypothetical protein